MKGRLVFPRNFFNKGIQEGLGGFERKLGAKDRQTDIHPVVVGQGNELWPGSGVTDKAHGANQCRPQVLKAILVLMGRVGVTNANITHGEGRVVDLRVTVVQDIF